MKLIVVEPHKSNYPNPISFSEGERLTVVRDDTEYKGWIRVKTKDGNKGWAPIQYLQIEEANKAVATHDYTATELNTRIGEELILHYELNDWGWVEKNNGTCGWVPMKITRIA